MPIHVIVHEMAGTWKPMTGRARKPMASEGVTMNLSPQLRLPLLCRMFSIVIKSAAEARGPKRRRD